MAVVTLKASQVTNADATTQTLNNSKVCNGRIKEIADTIEVTNGDSIASIYRMARVHSSWRMTELLLQCDAITSAAADIGLYDTAANDFNFATIYTEAAKAIIAKRTGKKVDKDVIYPTVQDGVKGVAFVEACIASSKRNGAWVKPQG